MRKLVQAFQFEYLILTSLSQNYNSNACKPFLSLISSSPTFSHTRVYSSIPDLKAKNSILAEYLVGSIKFSKDRALSVSSRFSRTQSLEKLEEAVNFLRGLGLSDACIHSVACRAPRVLFSDVGKNFRPKVIFFQDIGLSGPCLCTLITKNPGILMHNLDRALKPCVLLIMKVLNGDGRCSRKEQVDDLLQILSRCNTIGQLKCRLEANIAYLESCGVVGSQLSTLLVRHPMLFSWPKEKIEKIVSRAVDMNFTLGSKMLAHAINVLSCMSIKTLNGKFKVLRMSGFSKDETALMFRSTPRVFGLSEENLRCKLEFFLSNLKMDKLVIVRNPPLLGFSLEKRILPRCKIVEILKSSRLLKDDFNFRYALSVSNELFLEKYVLPFKNDSGELVLAAYEGKLVDSCDI